LGSYLLVFAIAAAACALFVPLTSALAHRVGAMDDTRKPAIPRSGGVALALGGSTALLLVGVVFTPTGLTLLATSRSLGTVLLGTFAILLLGMVDDIFPVRAIIKFGVQVGVAIGMYALGVRVELLSLPFGPADLGSIVGPAVTVLWLVGITNAFNLLDGADGVAAGSAFFAATAVFIMSVALGHPGIGLVAAALAGALLGFLPFNFPPAKAFLGDAGSMSIGFLLAGLAVEGSTKGPTLVAIAVPLVAFGVPVFDTTITLLRRVVRGRPLFEPDREHVHHHLKRSGLSPRQVVGVIYAVSAVFALSAMMFINPGVRSYAVALLTIGAGVWMISRYLHLHELNELARLARRGALQPKSIAANVELRRAAVRLADAHTLDDMKDGLAILLGKSEFDDVLLTVAAKDGDGERKAGWRLREGGFVEEQPARRADEWEVVCPFEGTGWSGELRLRRRLGRRSLLLDLNLLLELVQPALSDVAKRIEFPAAISR
jgi:UDP-GlcNAc:undecaprenyl-phosphate GlcNAc-1-phosphate transferase